MVEKDLIIEEKDKRTLIIGCGNPSRSDDSVGLYVINQVNRHLGKPPVRVDVALAGYEAGLEDGGRVTTIFLQQLGPELAELVTDYDLVIFVDAHTGSYGEDLRFAPVTPSYVTSAFSHHLEPAAVLALAEMLYGCVPQAYTISVRGYDFQFGTKLSVETRALADRALDQVLSVLGQPTESKAARRGG